MSTALLLLSSLVALPALAFASVPDPTWIAGLYDGADADDVILAVTSADALGTATRVAVPIMIAATLTALAMASALPARVIPAFQVRAPPGP